MSTFPAKKINRYPKLDTRAGINNIYPDTIRRLEIKIVSLTTIELNNQKNKKKNSSPSSMYANNRSGSFVLLEEKRNR